MKKKSQQSDEGGDKIKTIRNLENLKDSKQDNDEDDDEDLCGDNSTKKNEKSKKASKIRKFSYYMNGKRISQKNTVYQLLKNPIQFVSKFISIKSIYNSNV